ncbi:hypothetical protein Tco_1064676, partial [Tanacetum coccineum]
YLGMRGRQKWSSEDQRDIVILGPDPIRRIPLESVLAVEIDLT